MASSSGSLEDLTAALESRCSTQEAATVGAESGPGISKKALQKAAKKAERLQTRQAAAAATAAVKEADDPLGHNYGDLPLEDVQSKCISGRIWTAVSRLDAARKDETVLIRGRAQSTRGKGKIAFLIIREQGYTVQCVATVSETVSKGLVKYVTGLSKESIVDVEGIVLKPEVEIASTTQQVEIQVKKVYCVSKAAPVLPLNLDDAARSERDLERAEKEGVQYVKVGQDTRLNNRVLDLRTPANQAIFGIQSYVSMLFRQYLLSEGFVEIHTPKLIAGASEGGSAVFRIDYKGQPACLAQSPQLHKQMAICADFGRVFEIGPVFRAEDSFTHRHLCEFTGLDLEMEIKEHYFEVLDLLGNLFVSIFDGLNEKCKKQLEAINQQYPFETLQYLRKTVLLTFSEGVQMLKEAGVEVDAFGDLNTESERRLGQLVQYGFLHTSQIPFGC